MLAFLAQALDGRGKVPVGTATSGTGSRPETDASQVPDASLGPAYLYNCANQHQLFGIRFGPSAGTCNRPIQGCEYLCAL
jgi:hypothetical protein